MKIHHVGIITIDMEKSIMIWFKKKCGIVTLYMIQ